MPYVAGAVTELNQARRGPRRRLLERPLFAALVSGGIHLIAFAVLLRVVWQDKPAPPRQIIAEAWLGPPGAGGGRPAGGLKPPADKPAGALAVGARTGVAVPAAKDDDLKRLIGTFDTSAEETLPSGHGTASGTGGLGLAGGGEGALGAGGGGSGGGFGGVTGDGPVSGFFGQRGNAYKVVYVIDTSGSLAWMFDPVKRALIESIDQLRPTQSFHVIFAGGRPVELPERRLVPAIAAYKEPAKKFIRELVPELQCDPVAAMQRAFAVEPELVYFLTDGDFGLAGKELIARLRQWNADKRVHITTIGFGVKLTNTQLAGQPVGEPILRQIAEEHGGHFRWVSPDETEERK